MRILALVTEAFGGRGGIAEYNRNWIRAMAVNGHDVRVVTRLMPAGPIDLPSGIIQQYPGSAKASFALASIAEALRGADFLFCGHINLLPLAVLIGQILRLPVCLQVHGIDAWKPLGRIYRVALRKTTSVLSVSHYTKRRLLEWAPLRPERVHVAPNTFDETAFYPSARPTGLAGRLGVTDRRVILTVGRLDSRERYKGQDRVINLLPRLLIDHPDICFIIAGDGDDRTRLEEIVRQQGVSKHVHFAGFVPHSELPDLYRLADLFILAGFGEGFGIVLLEAMACGTPVIASSRDGSREAVLEGELGFVLDPDDPEALFDAILRCLEQPRHVPSGLDRFRFQPFRQRLEAAFQQCGGG